MGRAATQSRLQRKRLPILPIIDVLLVLLTFGLGMLTVVMASINEHGVKVKARMAGDLTKLKEEVKPNLDELQNKQKELGEKVKNAGAGTHTREQARNDAFGLPEIPDSFLAGGTPSDLIQLLKELDEHSAKRNEIWAAALYSLAGLDLTFWDLIANAREMCHKDLPPQPELNKVESPVKGLLQLIKVAKYGQDIYSKYSECVEGHRENISESILRFKSARPTPYTPITSINLRDYSPFDGQMTPKQVEAAKDKIRQYVDKNATRLKIFVEGHGDDEGSDIINYKVSLMRALYVASVIREHLNSQNKVEGKDYKIIPEGLGKSQPLP